MRRLLVPFVALGFLVALAAPAAGSHPSESFSWTEGGYRVTATITCGVADWHVELDGKGSTPDASFDAVDMQGVIDGLAGYGIAVTTGDRDWEGLLHASLACAFE